MKYMRNYYNGMTVGCIPITRGILNLELKYYCMIMI